jgi:preprotein translocase subunit SecA
MTPMQLRLSPADHPPMPGVVWGAYPQRREETATASPAIAAALVAALDGVVARLRSVAQAPRQRGAEQRTLQAVRAAQAAWQARDAQAHRLHCADLRARLARDGWGGARLAEALGCVAQAGAQSLGRDPYDSQLLAAAVLLDDRLAEMATGEGKTYAAALAAAVAALAGVPVHVMTANDYLVQRDACQLQPFFAALGLRVGTVLGTSSADERRAAYACDITYCTAREVAFDYLRDSLGEVSPGDELARRATRLAGHSGAPLLLRGLCMAVLDEADSLLIDEATMPLVLAQASNDAQQRAACFQALALARQLHPGRDVQLEPGLTGVRWLEGGLERLESLSAGLGGAWHNRRHRQDSVLAALEALHLLERDRHYLVREGRVQLLDAVTGRTADGRVWSRGLQTLVELKEGCTVSPATTTRTQISFQRFFARYLRLCGMSGTLRECRAELRALYRREVVPVALRKPSQRLLLPDRLFASAPQRWRAVVARVAALQAQGRPVLVGTDSVGDSETLAAWLTAAGVTHRVLNARHDADEAHIVAQAGQPGAVTVATHMAGRGTDIELGPGVAALGGLHVLSCQDNASARLDRQLIGRCARQGDPGSAEVFRSLDAPRWRDPMLSSALGIGRQQGEEGEVAAPRWLVRGGAAWLQRADQRRARRQRERLLEQDRTWEAHFN